MKIFAKPIMAILLSTLILSFGACGDEDNCYVCTGFDDGTESLEDLGTICEGDEDDGAGGTINADQLESTVQLYIGFGGTCVKK